jgi:hypothetical protein
VVRKLGGKEGNRLCSNHSTPVTEVLQARTFRTTRQNFPHNYRATKSTTGLHLCLSSEPHNIVYPFNCRTGEYVHSASRQG